MEFSSSINPAIVKKLKEWRDSPLQFVQDCIKVTPSNQQIELLAGATSIAKHKRTSVRSGHGPGKTSVAAWLILWFMTTRPYAKVPCTAPTQRQLRDVLKTEIVKWLRQSVLREEFIVQKERVFHREAPDEWWIRFISPSISATKEDQAETLAGLHGDHLLIVADEASGLPDSTFIPLEGALTSPDNKVLLIGNMTRNSGYFYDTHFDTKIKKSWNVLHWDSRKSSIVDASMPQYFADKYGLDSNIYRIRVLGEPPLQDEETLIPLWAALQCVGNEFEVNEEEPLYLGVDVARYGSDASIIMPRRGFHIYPWETFHKLNTIDLGGFVNQTYQELGANGVAIDVIGVGAGVADWLEKRNLAGLHQVNVTSSSSDIEKYHRLRDELWVRVRDNCVLGKYSFPTETEKGSEESFGDKLANELSCVRYKFNAHGGVVVESKKDLRTRGIESPNIADALCLTEYFHNPTTRVYTKPVNIGEQAAKRYLDLMGSTGQAWMGA